MRSAGSAARSMKNNTNVASAAITTDPAVNAAKTVSPRRTTNAVIDASRAWCARRFAATFGGRSTGRSLATSYGSITPRGGERPRPVDRRDQTGGAEQNGKMKIGATHVRKPIETMTSMTASTTLAVICS